MLFMVVPCELGWHTLQESVEVLAIIELDALTLLTYTQGHQ
jgi:hypothetical protein